MFRRAARFTESERENILALFDEMHKEVVNTRIENASLKGRLMEREASRPASYAAAAGRVTTVPDTRGHTTLAPSSQPAPAPLPSATSVRPKKRKRPRHPKQHKLILSHDAVDGSMDPVTVRAQLLRSVNPVTSGIRIKHIRPTRAGKRLVETHSQDDLEKLRSHPALESSGIATALPLNRDPRIIVYGVPTDLEDLDLRTAIWHQNVELRGEESVEDFIQGISPKFKFGRQDAPSTNWVFAVSPVIRVRLKRIGFLYLGWSRCRVKDFLSPPRCFKCLGVGHVEKYCRVQAHSCAHCGENHSKADCPNLQLPPKCALCQRRGLPHDHPMVFSCYRPAGTPP